MAGRGTVEDRDRKAHLRVLALTRDDAWATAVDPMHLDKPRIAGVGLGTTFGKTVAEALPDATIGLVPCAVGGSSIARWGKDQPWAREDGPALRLRGGEGARPQGRRRPLRQRRAARVRPSLRRRAA
jgi:hypothetical protein